VAHATDIRTFVSALPLHASIKQAIIERQGKIGRLLTLAEFLECGDIDEILKLIVRLPIDDQNILVDSLNSKPMLEAKHEHAKA
jgi:c-di-GMP-related signal transduction protein